MTTLVWCLFWLWGLTAVLRLICLAAVPYPRERDPVSRWEDAVGVAINVACCCFVWFLLHP